jgi:hypothetical protein
MPLDTTVKLGMEARLFLSSSAQSLLSIDLADIATENIGGTITWDEIGFLRYPISRAEPTEITDIRKRFVIDHTKKGAQQRKTGSFAAAWQNAALTMRRYNSTQNLIKIEWHVEGVDAVDEYEYLKSVRFTNLTREAPEAEVVERVEFVFSTWGRRPAS